MKDDRIKILMLLLILAGFVACRSSGTTKNPSADTVSSDSLERASKNRNFPDSSLKMTVEPLGIVIIQDTTLVE